MSVQAQISGDIKIRDLEGGLYAEGGIVTSKPFGEANGFATLGGDGKVPSSQLPSYVDDVVEVANYAALPIPGETGKIYITLDTNYVYRWAGSTYVQIIDTSAVWGAITGTLSNQTDLQNALDAKVPYTGATGNVDLGTYGIKADYSQFNLTPSSVPTTVGTLSWDSFYRTLQLVDGDGDTTLQIGQEQRVLVHNNTGSTLTDGQVVYVTGSTGELPSVSLASNTSEATSSVTFGVVTESIANGANGFITTSGIVHGLNTLAFNEGDALWLGSTAGTFTNVKPVAPANSVLIGYVIKKAGGNGSIFVKIQNGYELEELHDVLITSVANNQGIFWDSATSLWKNKSIPTALGYTPLGGDGVAGRIPYYTGTTTLGNEAAFNYDANTNRLGVNTNTPNATIGANAGIDSGYSLLLKNADNNYNGIGFSTSSVYGNVIGTEKLGTAPARNLTLLNQSGYISITENGNLGVNILNPNAGIDIYSSTSSSLWLHTANSGVSGTDGVRFSLFSNSNAVLRNNEGSLAMSSEGDFYVVTLGAENLRVESSTGKVGIGNPASVPEMLTVNGSIQQSSVISALLKTDLNGKLIPAVAGSDYLTPSAISGALNTVVKFTSPTQIGNSNITDDGSTITLGSKTFVANGNLGVGTSNPAVSGVGIDIYSATNTGLRFHNAASGTTVSDGAGINFSSGLNLGITNYEAGTIDIVTNGNSGVFIASNGYVGINGAVGGYPLDVSGSIKQTTVTSSMLKADASGVLVAAVAGTDYQAPLSNIVTGFSAANNVALWSGTTTLTGTSNLWYNSTSNFLGIGTNNPQRRLTIFNATLDSQVQISGGAPSVALTEAVTGGIYQAKFAMATAAGHYVSGAVAGDFVLLSQTGATIFATSSTEKMRITSSGNVGIGTTSPGGKLVVVGASSNTYISIDNVGSGENYYAANSVHIWQTSGSERLRITTQGQLGLAVIPQTWWGSRKALEINNGGAFAGVDGGWTEMWGNSYLDNTATSRYLQTGNATLLQSGNTSGGGFTFLVAPSGTAGSAITFSAAMRILNNGNVGIGTSSPDDYGAGYKMLAINGSTAGILQLRSNDSGVINIVGTSSSADFEAFLNKAITFKTGTSTATERMRITSGGNVGIGTSSPVRFEVVGNADLTQGYFKALNATTSRVILEASTPENSGNISLRSHSSNYGPETQYGINLANTTALTGNTGSDSKPFIIGVTNAADIVIGTSNTERMRIKSGGNVGIGTTSPQDKLDVNGSIRFRANTPNFTAVGDSAVMDFVPTSIFPTDPCIRIAAIGTATVGAQIRFQTGTTTSGPEERMRITSAGTIGIAGSSDVNNAQGMDKLAIGFLASNYGWIQSYAGTTLYLNKIGNAVYAGTQRIDNNSDARIKENIAPIENALDVVLALNGRKFNMLDEDGILRYGFVAQEVQPHLADFVTESDRTFEKGDIKIENLLTLESSGAAWGALLVEAIKQQQQQIEELKQLILNK